jgi:predicted permease
MQVILVILVITAAVSYIAWQFYQRFFKADGKCDGCAIGKMQEK